jgi:hypothetical protein
MLNNNENFLHQVVVMLPAFEEMEVRLARETGHNFNLFNLMRTDEPTVSRFLSFLLNPKEMHGQGDLFLRLFIARFLPEWRDSFSYDRAKVVSVGELIDVTISDDKHWFGIENKIFDAVEQKCQVDRYLDALNTRSEQGDYRLIYLSPNGKWPTRYSLSESAKKCHQDKFVMGAWIRPDESPYDLANGVANSSIEALVCRKICLDWLIECEHRCYADNVRWFLRQFKKLIHKRLLSDGGSSMTGNAIVDLALRSTDNLDAALRIGEKLQQIRENVTKSFLSDVQRHIERWIEQHPGDWELCINWPDGNWIKTPSKKYLHILLRIKSWPSMVGSSLTADKDGPSAVNIGVLAPTQKTWETDQGAKSYGEHDFFIDDNKRQEIATVFQTPAPESTWWIISEILKDIDGQDISDWTKTEVIKRLHAKGEKLAMTIANRMGELAQKINIALN